MPSAQVIPFPQHISKKQRIKLLLQEATPQQPDVTDRLEAIEGQLSELLNRLPLERGQ